MDPAPRILCIDWKQDGSFRKNWDTLGVISQKIDLKQALTLPKDCLHQCLVVLVHRSVFRDNFESEFAKLQSVLLQWQKTCIGVVTDGSEQQHHVSECGRICLVHTPFPSLPRSLDHLCDAFKRLVGEIDKATTPSELQGAWERFDRPERMNEHLLALGVLCQGYLVASVGLELSRNYEKNVTIALKDIGWIIENEDHTLELNPLLQKCQISPSDKWQFPEYWLSPFGGIANLQNGLESEFGGEPSSEISAFLNGIMTGSVTPSLVADAYMQLKRKLDMP